MNQQQQPHPSTIYEDQQASVTPVAVPHQLLSTPPAAAAACIDISGNKQQLVIDDEQPKSKTPRTSTALILTYFLLWFILSTGYNIFNKKAMNFIKLPWLVGTIQILTGVPIFSLLWFTKLRKTPVLTSKEVLTILPLGAFHCGCHICAVLAMSVGSVSFAHIIKSGEPITTSILSGILLSEIHAWQVYASLIPVISGVAIASVSEPQFSFLAFLTAMGSNCCSSLRSVYSKQKMSTPIGQHMDARNLYAVLTIISFCILCPLALVVEGPKVSTVWAEALDNGASNELIILYVFLSGLCYYWYNEVAFSALELVSPVTHAVGSTFKRVFIIGGSIVVFQNYPDFNGYLGMTIAIAGVGVYSLVKNKFKRKPSPTFIPSKVSKV